MKTIKISSQFVWTKQEIEQYNALPDNMPDIELTAKQKKFVDELYYKYIGKLIDNQSWSAPLYKIEMREKWPSGSRMREVQAKRIVLNALHSQQGKGMTAIQAARYFLSAIDSRDCWRKIVRACYKLEN